MVNKDDVVNCAKTYIGTPYHHQGRVKGVGIDCCGLLICVGKELGLTDYDIDGYSRRGDGVDFIKEFCKACGQYSDYYDPGNMVIIKVGKYPHHCGILSRLNGKLSLIHAYQSLNAVKEHYLDKSWEKRIVGCFEYPNVKP